MKVSQRVQAIPAGGFADLKRKANQWEKAHGKPVIDFSIGSSNIPPSPEIKEALAQAALEDGSYQYALGPLPEMVSAVQTWYKERYGADLAENELFLLKGSQEALSHLPMVLCDPGDRVLVPDPFYPIYGAAPGLADARVETMPLKEENGYLIQLDQIADPDSVTLMVVSYPSNPTGAKAPDSFYEQLIAFAKVHDIMIVHDNAYSELVFEGDRGKSFLSFPGAKEVGVELNSFSKAYSMGGARLAVLVGNEEMVSAYRRLVDMTDFCVFPAVQRAGARALASGTGFCESVCAEYKRRRDLLTDAFGQAGWTIARPDATMFVWARIPDKFGDSRQFADALLEQCGILVNPGVNFGSEGERYVRLALVRSDEEVKEAARRILESGLMKTAEEI